MPFSSVARYDNENLASTSNHGGCHHIIVRTCCASSLWSPGIASTLILEGEKLTLIFAALFVLDNHKAYGKVRNQGVYASIVLFLVSASLSAISYAVGNSLVFFYASLGICGMGVLGVRLSIQFKRKNAT